MTDSPFYKVESDDFKVTFILGAEDEPETADSIDAVITLPDHSRWSATFISISEIQRIMGHWRTTGECADGAYFYCTDLVIIRDVGIPSMVRFLERMIAVGDHVNALTRLEESAPHNDEMAVTFNDDSTELPNPVRPAASTPTLSDGMVRAASQPASSSPAPGVRAAVQHVRSAVPASPRAGPEHTGPAAPVRLTSCGSPWLETSTK